MTTTFSSRREAQLARESAAFVATIDEATRTTAAERRQQLDDRLDAMLARAGAATLRPPHYRLADWPADLAGDLEPTGLTA